VPVHHRSVDSCQDRLNLAMFEVLDDPLTGPFEGHAKQALSGLDLIRMMCGDIAEEGVNGGKPNVTCGHTVVAVSLQVSEKR